MTLDAWRILRILKHVVDHDGRVTIAILADLVRGAGGGSFTAGKKGKGAQKDKMDLNLEDLCGGKVTLLKDVRGNVSTRDEAPTHAYFMIVLGHRDAHHPAVYHQLSRGGLLKHRIHGQRLCTSWCRIVPTPAPQPDRDRARQRITAALRLCQACQEVTQTNKCSPSSCQRKAEAQQRFR